MYALDEGPAALEADGQRPAERDRLPADHEAGRVLEMGEDRPR